MKTTITLQVKQNEAAMAQQVKQHEDRNVTSGKTT